MQMMGENVIDGSESIRRNKTLFVMNGTNGN